MFNFQNTLLNQDVQKYNETIQNNFAAFVKSTQIATENAQAIAKRASEILQKEVGSIVEVTKEIMSSSSPEQASHKQQAFLQESATSYLNSSKELYEMVSKSAAETLEILSKSATENVVHTAKKPVKA